MSTTPQTGVATTESLEQTQIHALLHSAGIASINDLGWLRATGEDRVRWLNGMVTNSIQDLKPGDGCYNFILNAQGRIQGTAYAFAQPESILLQTDRSQLANILAFLDHFIIMDDVELTEATESELQTGLALIGPEARVLLSRIGLNLNADGTSSVSPSLHEISWQSSSITVISAHSPLVPRFELWASSSALEALRAALINEGAVPCAPEALEALRLLEGTPRYGTDIRDKDLPQETNQTRALHFAKGCYLGQEIVERIRSRGAVHRTFGAFRLTGPLPPPGSPIEVEGKPVGELTSTTAIPFASGTLQLGLGYIRREALDRAQPLVSAGSQAVSASLPVHEP